jgi:MYXO-CTERM domain-containing protein
MTRTPTAYLAALAFLTASQTAAAQEAPPIVNGTTTAQYQAVGALLAVTSNWGAHFCSATLIHKKWILTAAHCVDAMDDYEGKGADIYFTTGKDVYDNVTDYDVLTSWVMNPNYRSSNVQAGYDIGLGELQTGITSATPMPVNTDSITNSWVGKELTYVGYGITGDLANDSGYKRYAEMPIYQYDSQVIYAQDTSDEQNLCSGDSGGAALNELSDGTFEIVGVNSFVYSISNPNRPCEEGGSGVMRTDTSISWIESYVELESDTDTDADTDTDTDSDSDADADTDTDADADTDADPNGEDSGDTRPPRRDSEDETDDGLFGCSTASATHASGLLGLMGIVALTSRRRKQAAPGR